MDVTVPTSDLSLSPSVGVVSTPDPSSDTLDQISESAPAPKRERKRRVSQLTDSNTEPIKKKLRSAKNSCSSSHVSNVSGVSCSLHCCPCIALLNHSQSSSAPIPKPKKQAGPKALRILKLWQDAVFEVSHSKKVLLKGTPEHAQAHELFQKRYKELEDVPVQSMEEPEDLTSLEIDLK